MLGASLFWLTLAVAQGTCAEADNKAPRVDPAVQGLVTGASRPPAITRAAPRGCKRPSNNHPTMPPPIGNWAKCGSPASG